MSEQLSLLSPSEAEPSRRPAQSDSEALLDIAGHVKRNGVHYTPDGLARFLGRRLVDRIASAPLTVLDPACGDGVLLEAVADAARHAGLPDPHLVGVDVDAAAVDAARSRLARLASPITLRVGDFLDHDQLDAIPDTVDVVVSNPPYVRTQLLGAERAQELGRRYGLTGRVDLYHVFVAEMTRRLGPGGVLGVICSNRFINTRGGRAMRELLGGNYELEELWDLGDTRLFEASVLPAIVIASRDDTPARRPGTFVKVYEAAKEGPNHDSADLLDALQDGLTGPVRVDERRFLIERGHIGQMGGDRPWQLVTPESTSWLETVAGRTERCLGDLGPIRVGIKTTADTVFIRDDWGSLDPAFIPEAELLKPLLTHRVAGRWVQGADQTQMRSVLYTHETVAGRRRPIDLARFPRAALYLEQHRERLEGRRYVAKAKRQWFEIWVPQQPADWAFPKLVWPDISEEPKFFVDTSGAVVNGDCYWLSMRDVPALDAALALAVANSRFATRFYDQCSGNRLYSGKRRYITQYLEALPIPRASETEKEHIAALINDVNAVGDDERGAVEAAIERAVEALFGLEEPRW